MLLGARGGRRRGNISDPGAARTPPAETRRRTARPAAPCAARGRPRDERSDGGETASALASDSRVSSGGVRCPRSSIEMYETERPALAARASWESLRRRRSLLRLTANLSARPAMVAPELLRGGEPGTITASPSCTASNSTSSMGSPWREVSPDDLTTARGALPGAPDPLTRAHGNVSSPRRSRTRCAGRGNPGAVALPISPPGKTPGDAARTHRVPSAPGRAGTCRPASCVHGS